MAIKMPLEAALAYYATIGAIDLIEKKRTSSKNLKMLEEAHPISIIHEFFWDFAIMETNGHHWSLIEDQSRAVQEKLAQRFMDLINDRISHMTILISINIDKLPQERYPAFAKVYFENAKDPLALKMTEAYRIVMEKNGIPEKKLGSTNYIYAFCEFFFAQQEK